MGLLKALNLPSAAAATTDTRAKPAALRRARLAARLRKGGQREVMQAAIDAASGPGSNTAVDLDQYIDDEGNPSRPVSTMAPLSAYGPGEEGKPEDKGLAGRIRLETQSSVTDATDPSAKTEIQVSTRVEARTLWKERLGDGERIYEKDPQVRGLRKLDGFKSPPELVMEHEHVHLVIAAHVSARVQEFGNAAFGAFEFDDGRAQELKDLLDELADETRKIVTEWFDRVGVPDHANEIERAEKVTGKLLKDGTIERRVRTALLKTVRKNARALAKFRLSGPRP